MLTVQSNSSPKYLLKLAWPVMLTQMGHILTNMVDTIFLGQISSTHQAAGLLASNLYTLILVFAIGVSYVLTPLISSADFEKNDLKKATLFKNSLALNFIIAFISFLVLYLSSGLLIYMQQPSEVVVLAEPFYNVLIFSMIPVSIFFTCKQYCEGLSLTLPALYISVAGNVLNIILNYCLIYGVSIFPETWLYWLCVGIIYCTFIYGNIIFNVYILLPIN